MSHQTVKLFGLREYCPAIQIYIAAFRKHYYAEREKIHVEILMISANKIWHIFFYIYGRKFIVVDIAVHQVSS